MVQVGDMRAAWKKMKAAGITSDMGLRCFCMHTVCGQVSNACHTHPAAHASCRRDRAVICV